MNEINPRYRRAAMECAYDRLAEHPETQAEAIAHHYVAMAATAADLYHILKAKRHGATAHVDDLIVRCFDQIKLAHQTDLGLPLAWPISDPTGRRHPSSSDELPSPSV